MKALAAYVMRGRAEAIFVVSVMAVLSLALLPLTIVLLYMSGAALALVTLRLGPQRGIEVMFGATLALTIMGQLFVGVPTIGGMLLMGHWLPVWLLAGNLRRRGVLAATLRTAGLFGVMVVVGFFLAVSEPEAWWLEALLKASAVEVEDPAVLEGIQQLAGVMTGLLAAGLLFAMLLALFIGRWWQALLYNPGGFGDEFRQLRLGELPALAMLICMALGMAGIEALQPWVNNLLFVGMPLFVMQGLALVHWLVRHYAAEGYWLPLFYVLLVFSQFIGMVLVMLAGVVDNWFDFRAFMANRAQK